MMIQQFRKTLAVGFVALTVTMGGTAMAATVTMDFEGVVLTGTNMIPATPYTEDGFMLTNNVPGGTDGIFLPASGLNTNGSAIFGWCSSSPSSCGSLTTITLSKVGGGVFDFLSFDSATLEGTGTASLQVIGNLSSGGTTSVSIVQDASWDPETLNFLGVTSVDFVFGTGPTDNNYAFDNLMMSTAGTVPEPGSLALLGLALASLGFGRAQRTHHPA